MPPSTSTTASPRFHKLPASKRERIEKAAIAEFADKGYEHAKTSTISTNAGVSVGALFAYFPTKKDLYLHVVQRCIALIEGSVGQVVNNDLPVMEIIEEIVKLIVRSSYEERESIVLYLRIAATDGVLEGHAAAMELERYTSTVYVLLLQRGQREGSIRSDLPATTLAFHMDNIFMTLQYSLASGYFQQRMMMYKAGQSHEELVAHTLELLRSALTIRGN